MKLSNFLTRKDNMLVYTHSQPMILTIPKFYEQRNMLTLDYEKDQMMFFGIAKITIGNQSSVMIIPAMLHTCPSSIESNNKSEEIIFTYQKNDIFIADVFIIRNSVDLYNIFLTFVTLGKKIPFLPYDYLPYIFDNAVKISGIGLNARRTCYEILFSESARSEKDLNVRYRLTNMKNDYQLISHRNIIYGPKSVSAKLLGSYFNDGMIGSLLVEGQPEEKASTIETYLKT